MLTQNCIGSRVFQSAFQRTKIWSSSSEFVLFSRRNLAFKHSSDAEMSLKEGENKIFKYWDVQIDRLIAIPKNTLHRQRRRV